MEWCTPSTYHSFTSFSVALFEPFSFPVSFVVLINSIGMEKLNSEELKITTRLCLSCQSLVLEIASDIDRKSISGKEFQFACTEKYHWFLK